MNYRSNLNRLWIFIGILLIGLIAGLTWANYQFSKNNPGGNDFLVHWMGTRELFLNGISPYSDQTALKIQNFVYGRPANIGEHELRVAYPLYSVSLFFPFALIEDYTLARAIWMTVLEIALILTAFMSIRVNNWKLGFGMLALYILFSLFWYHSVRPLINGNAIILVTLAVTGAFLAIKNGADELAGVLLALSTIKPHNVILVITFIIFWAYRQKRWRLIGWFTVTLSLLIISAMLLLPDWIIQNIREIVRYATYNPPGTLGSAVIALFPGLTPRIKWAITFILALVLMFEWGKGKQADFKNFYWTACITLVISQWIGIQTDPGNFILLLPCIPLLFAIWVERWKKTGQIISIISIFLLFGVIWILFLQTIEPGYQPQQSPVLFFPLPLFLLITLFWVRWWAIYPQNIWMDDLMTIDNSRNY